VREGENGRLLVSSLNPGKGIERVLSDLGPLPASFHIGELQAEFPMRGFSLAPDGRSFLTSVYRHTGDIWIASGLRAKRQALWRRML
jgi:hypothetical protein